MKVIAGGKVTAAKGFQAASTAAGIKYQGRTDMAMVYSEKPCVAAGTMVYSEARWAECGEGSTGKMGSGYCLSASECTGDHL